MNKVKFWKNSPHKVKIVDIPDAISDEAMLDLYCPGIWESMEPTRAVSSWPAASFGAACNKLLHIASEGRVICRTFGSTSYVYRLETEQGLHVYLQKQFVEYFRRIYPGCIFHMNKSDDPVAIYHEKLVGFIMPLKADAPYRETVDITYREAVKHLADGVVGCHT